MKPWSISTTIRNPERIMRFLSTAKRLEGKLFDEENQSKFQIYLIQDRNYEPKKMSDIEKAIFDDPDKEFTFNNAKNIFEQKKYESPPMRGRTSFAPLRQMGLCVGSPKVPIKLTDFGKNFLNRSDDVGDYFFNYFLKWELPNPVESKNSEYNIKPFLGTLHLIKTVNGLCLKNNKNDVGISKYEFGLFVPTLVDHNDISIQAQRIIDYRKCKTKTSKKEYEKKFVCDFLANGKKPSNVLPDKMIKNLHDYGDNAIRYFRMTKYLRIRGNGNFVDLEPRRGIELDELLKTYSAAPIGFDSENEYVHYLGDQTRPELPWNTEVILQKINDSLTTEISDTVKKIEDLNIKIHSSPDVTGNMQQQNSNLREYLVVLQKNISYHDMTNVENIQKCIGNLENIYQVNNRPIELEKQTALAFMALNDADEIKPNYPVGDDGDPTFTAPGGMADLECYYKNFNMICEVTMLTDSKQWINEGQPVMRHLRKFENEDKNKKTYCIFIAPKIHEDTAEIFENSVRYGYKRVPQKIIPITIKTFTQLLHILRTYKKNNGNRPIPHLNLMALYNILIKLVDSSNDSSDWVCKIPNAIADWGANLE